MNILCPFWQSSYPNVTQVCLFGLDEIGQPPQADVGVSYSSAVGSGGVALGGTAASPCPPMAADFSVTPSSGTSPLTVDCAYTGTGIPTIWTWTVVRDLTGIEYATSNQPAPSFTLVSSEGVETYTITLTVENECLDSSAASHGASASA